MDFRISDTGSDQSRQKRADQQGVSAFEQV